MVQVQGMMMFVLERIRDQLLKTGAKAIQAIGRARWQLDLDHCIDKEEFHNFFSYTDLKVDPQDLADLLNTYETPDHRRVRFQEFLRGVRGQLNGLREKLVLQAFQKLDENQDGYVTLDRIRQCYNGKCHPAVMLGRCSQVQEVTEAFLDASFGNLEHVSLHDFMEYYTLVGSTIDSCNNRRFEVLIMKHWKVSANGMDVDEIENKIKLIVYKNRIRSCEFMRDFDKLRGRLISDAQFASALDNSSIGLSVDEVNALCDNYRIPEDPQSRICWTSFCDQIDSIFTFKELEKTPWRQPPTIPDIPGLAPQRFEQGIIYLGPEKENRVNMVLQNLKVECRRRRVSLQGLFDDAVTNRNSTKAVGHVTKQQFCQALSSKAGLRLSNEEASLLIEKFDDLRNGMVNHIAFSAEVDPFLQPEDLV